MQTINGSNMGPGEHVGERVWVEQSGVCGGE